MSSISTRFTERFAVRHPLPRAGMAFAGQEPEPAIEVSRAGGIGAIGVGFTRPEQLRTIIRRLQDELGDAPFNINFITFFGNEGVVRVLVTLWNDSYSVYGVRKRWKAARRAGIDIGRARRRSTRSLPHRSVLDEGFQSRCGCGPRHRCV